MLGVRATALLDYDRARASLKRAADLIEKSRGRRDPEWAETVCRLGHVELQTGNLPAAETLYRSAAEVRKASLGDDSVPYAECLEQLGLIAKAARNLSRAGNF